MGNGRARIVPVDTHADPIEESTSAGWHTDEPEHAPVCEGELVDRTDGKKRISTGVEKTEYPSGSRVDRVRSDLYGRGPPAERRLRRLARESGADRISTPTPGPVGILESAIG